MPFLPVGGNAILVCIGWGAGTVGIFCLPVCVVYIILGGYICCYCARGIFAIDVLLMMGWLYSFGGNAIMHRLGGGCGRYILFAGARHILFWGIYVVYGLVQNTMMLLVSHYLPFSFSILLCTDIIIRFGTISSFGSVSLECRRYYHPSNLPPNNMQNSAYSPVRRSWPQREDVFTASI